MNYFFRDRNEARAVLTAMLDLLGISYLANIHKTNYYSF